MDDPRTNGTRDGDGGNGRPKIPVNVICGPLGIGKTTSILQYLTRAV